MTLVHQRRDFSQKRMEDLVGQIRLDPELPTTPDICMYITGSYGRLEATQFSDVDVFFLKQGCGQINGLSPVDKTLIDACLIRSCRKIGFPEFTKGGVYLTTHYLDDILSNLGSPNDDFFNNFTARMLLLLESKPIHNPDVYDTSISSIVESYYRDYHDHDKDFLPVFLVNDIQRYWKTMCLNYEHKRNRKEDMEPWPAAGSKDTWFRCLMLEPEVGHEETDVH